MKRQAPLRKPAAQKKQLDPCAIVSFFASDIMRIAQQSSAENARKTKSSQHDNAESLVQKKVLGDLEAPNSGREGAELVVAFDPELCLFEFAPGSPECEIIISNSTQFESHDPLEVNVDYCIPIQRTSETKWGTAVSFVRKTQRKQCYYYTIKTADIEERLQNGEAFLDVAIYDDRIEISGAEAFSVKLPSGY